MFCLVVPVRSI